MSVAKWLFFYFFRRFHGNSLRQVSILYNTNNAFVVAFLFSNMSDICLCLIKANEEESANESFIELVLN